MKKTIYIALLIFPLWGLGGCNDDDDNCQGIDCLPPATQTGAGTFGCLVNGEPFVDNSGFFNCFYQLVDGEYFFNITANFNNKTPKLISLATNSLEIESNASYQLLTRDENSFYAEVTFDNAPPLFLNDNTTDTSNSGLVSISLIDSEENIISGTFNFQIRDTINDKIYTVTEGRFDSLFTQ
ncbi:MAG: hypothetical protein WA775_07085 [Psychroserpens sp.]|uniref:hypothetical protein n=1 Tax=Psychroserpens sp. TaxID=2020870 RepID=UPI003C948418